MAELVKLKDYSFYQVDKAIESKKLYQAVQDNTTLILDTSMCDIVGNQEEIKPILEIRKSKEENKVEIITFGYAGRFSYQKVKFDITYRFGVTLLERMITIVNDFDIKSLDYEAENNKNKNNTDSLALKILYMNFVFKLEKLSVLGIPKSYQKIEHHTNTLKGQLDINRFIKKDMPFQGKISSSSYEQVYVQEILDVLYGAMVIVENSLFKLVGERLFQIKNLIYHYANKRFVDERTIENAIYHKSIQNSLYGEFKVILEIASYIIRYNNESEYKANNIFSGLIFDVSLLWESYLYKLLKKAFEKEDWEVLHEDEQFVYKNKFYERNMYPDIVIKNEKEKKVLVFDAKSKSMQFRKRYENGGDVDRNDFFQINTYMTYYDKQGYDVLAGGLLYPMDGNFEKHKHESYSYNWFGNNDTNFIVDGIELHHSYSEKSIKSIVCREKRFIKRINNLMNKTQSCQSE